MTATLQGALAELIDVLRDVANLNFVPSSPVQQIPVSPSAVVYSAQGVTRDQPQGIMTGLHTVTIAVLVPLTDLSWAVSALLPFAETIPRALYLHRAQQVSQNYQTFGEITYTLGPVEWPDNLTMFGYLFTIPNLKVQSPSYEII